MASIVGIGAPPKRSGPPPMPKRKMQEEAAPQYAATAPDKQPMAHEMAETPSTERAEHSAARVTPEAVCYRSADEICSACEYLVEGHCELLDMPVEEGASCNGWSAKTGEMDALHEEPMPEIPSGD
jgi:hypothetical protein